MDARHTVLADAVHSVHVTRTEAGAQREVLALPLDHLNGWLFGVNAERVKPDLRAKLVQYQRECFAVLNAYWRAIHR